MATKKDVERAVRELPGQSAVIARLLAVVDDPTTQARHLGDLVSADPTLLVNVLRVANSPLFGCRSRVTDPAQACALLGSTSLRAVAVAAMAHRTLPPDEWSHALTTGAAATVLARGTAVPLQQAYAVGLLHDIGRAVQRQLSGHLLIGRDVHEVCVLELERRAHRLDHTEFGRITLEVLGFPEEVVDAVASHHVESGPIRPLAALVRAANHLAHVVEQADPSPRRIALLDEALRALGRDLREVDALAEEAKVEVGHLAQTVLG